MDGPLLGIRSLGLIAYIGIDRLNKLIVRLLAESLKSMTVAYRLKC